MFWVSLLMVATILITSCNEASFTQPGEKVAAKKPEIKVERFPLSSSATRIIDMVWIIDNSGSMLDEIELVRQNFGTFVATVAGFSDLNLGLITADTSQDRDLGIDLRVLAPNVLSQQFNFQVGSSNALSLLASGICDPNSTQEMRQGTNFKICDHNLNAYIEGVGNIASIRGQLRSFFRQDSKKVFVVVTDDNAQGIDSTNFLNVISSHFPQTEAYLFGFVGIDENSKRLTNPQTGRRQCSVAQVGSSYIDLASKTNGNSFDICIADWSAHFNELTKNVENIINTEFSLNTSKLFTIVDIALDGVSIPQDKYNVQNNKIIILDKMILHGPETLEVKYTIPKD